MERFVGLKVNFMVDAELNWEPMKVDEGQCDVLPLPGLGEEPGSWV